MAKKYAEKFYKSSNWQKIREAYISKVGGLCERCYKKGIVTAGVIVHHKKHINPDNINDPLITNDFSNLELLCFDCHNKEHIAKNGKRYKLDKNGNIIIKREE